MFWRILGACSLLWALGGSAALGQGIASERKCITNYVDLQFRITDEHDRPIPVMVHAELLNSSQVPIQQRFIKGDGQTSFQVAAAGDYYLRVTGDEIQETTSETVTVNCGDRGKMTFVHVKPKESSGSASVSNSATGKESVGTMTSASQLKIPPDARKAFDKGYEAYGEKEYEKAVTFFQQAANAYPQYDAAYNNLGVAYMKLDEPHKAMAALETAVKLNDKDADADRNLARLLIRQEDFPRADELVKKSLMVEPSDPGGLTLAAVTEFRLGRYEDAVKSAERVHQLPHDGFASCHYVAGQALEHLNLPEKARTEYQLYLQEMPNGPEAPASRTALARIDDQVANSQ
jgi:tetratricopeptide (TPR) repeat protein